MLRQRPINWAGDTILLQEVLPEVKNSVVLLTPEQFPIIFTRAFFFTCKSIQALKSDRDFSDRNRFDDRRDFDRGGRRNSRGHDWRCMEVNPFNGY